MRSSNKRSRNKPNRNRSVGNVVNRVFDSSGPEGKVRGTPQQIIDKYSQLARDAQLSNDRVATENFQQHAEHYTRMLGEALREQEAKREAQEAQQQQQQQNRNRQRERDQRDSNDPGSTPQPEVGGGTDQIIDVAQPADAGLVETPESKRPEGDAQDTRKRPPRRPRKPRNPDDGAPTPPADPGPSSEAAE